MKIICFIILLISTSCAVEIPRHVYDPYLPEDSQRLAEAQVITDEFQASLTYWFTSEQIHFNFKDLASEGLPSNTVGVCWYREDESRDVEYDRGWWDTLSDIQKKNLVYHENGHCQLSREHRCSEFAPGQYSIMYPTLFGTDYLLQNMPDMEKELFSWSNQAFNDCSQ